MGGDTRIAAFVYTKQDNNGIGITPGILFSATRGFKNHMRINCGYPWNEATESALEKLGQIVCQCNSS